MGLESWFLSVFGERFRLTCAEKTQLSFVLELVQTMLRWRNGTIKRAGQTLLCVIVSGDNRGRFIAQEFQHKDTHRFGGELGHARAI